MAASLDGFIAGPDDDLSWLPTDPNAEEGEGVLGFAAFMAEVGALLMGRRTYDVVTGFGGEWLYGDTPVLVATTRPLEPVAPTVRAVRGDIDAVVEQAIEAAGDRDVYIDGGALIQSALQARRVDEIVVTMVPVLLGQGVPLFGTLEQRQPLVFEHHATYGSMVQLRARVVRDDSL